MASLHRRTLLASAVAGFALPAQAQKRMPRQTTLIVPFAAGGAADIIGRAVADRLGAMSGSTIIVENRGGAGSNVGLAAVAKAEPDGSVIGLASIALAVNPSLYRAMPFDPLRDLAPLTLALETPNVVIVPATSPIRSVADLIAAAKAKPDGLSYASAGIGSSLHLAAILFCQQAGVAMTHVPYRGTNPALGDLISGRIDVMFDNASTAVPQTVGGTVRAIAVTTAERIAALPDIPTVSEAGLRGYLLSNWWGSVAPAGLPPESAGQLTANLRAALRDEATRSSVRNISGTIVASDADEFRAHLHRESSRWRDILAAARVERE